MTAILWSVTTVITAKTVGISGLSLEDYVLGRAFYIWWNPTNPERAGSPFALTHSLTQPLRRHGKDKFPAQMARFADAMGRRRFRQWIGRNFR